MAVTFDEYQKAAMRTAKRPDLTNAALGLAGEAGEFCDTLKKHVFQGHDFDRLAMILELGDVLWYVALAAQCLGVSIEEIAEANVGKLVERYPKGFSEQASRGRK